MWAYLVTLILSFYLRVISWTVKFTFIGEENLPEGAYIFAFWHSRIALAGSSFRGRGIKVLVSPSRDGEITVDVFSRFGYRFIRGSASNSLKGATSLREILRSLKDGKSQIAVTPDGPRGPKKTSKAGIAYAASLSGRPIIPLGGWAKSSKILDTWDNMILPYPFTKVTMVVGEPVYIGRKEDLSTALKRIDQGINKADSEAEKFVNLL
ncbi:MAG: lysophospholipid acyltransferase family protein [Elusimicrobia bacterium]|nr:lysophospholipid acyltransferase family protein [Elusimicrobiota bacterium]